MSATADRPLRARPLGVLAVAAVALAGLASPSSAAPSRTVVVTGAGDVAAAVQHAGGQVLHRLSLVPGVVASLPVGRTVAGFVVAEDRALVPSGKPGGRGGAGSPVAPATGGAGVTVAVVDTGVADVPQLAGRVTHLDVTGEGAGDGYGHGTFVAGLVAGTGLGAAPEARVLDVRVGHDDGTTSLTEVLAGLEAVAAHPEVDVVNLSLSSESPLPWQFDPLTVALDSLWDRGMTVVVPAGNDGPGRGTVASPGVDPNLLTVGGLDDAGTPSRSDDTVADWSARGGNGAAKPDLVARGSHVVSVVPQGSAVWTANPGSRRADGTFSGSGTSFSTAVTSGSVAALLAARPGLSPDQVKSLVMRSAYDVSGPRRATGAGALDLAAALVAKAPKGGDPATGGKDWETDDLIDLDANGWAASSWAARQWTARQWAARQWTARQWSARQWSARQWSAVAWE